MTVVLKDLGVCYFPAPKVANTSIKHLLFEIENGERFEASEIAKSGKRAHIHQEYSTPRFNKIDRSEYKSYLRFTVIRDPVERALSAWRNRVIHHGELTAGKVSAEELEKLGLVQTPDLNTFVENLEAYRGIKNSIRVHTDPMVAFLGRNPRYYHLIFMMNESNLIEDFFKVLTGKKYKMRRAQTGGPSVDVSELTPENLQKLKAFYSEDYKAFDQQLNGAGARVRRS